MTAEVTLEQLREVLRATEPGTFLEGCDVQEAFYVMRRAMPNLIAIADAVAKMPGPDSWDQAHCAVCGAYVYQSNPPREAPHHPGCGWVLARAMRGGA